mgnify:FL=1
MAFLDNSGDIILDAVLTDTGRMRMAKGDGSFRIVKFALGDDEINYELFDKVHPSGSAYYDLEVLQTPILEAFTDNAASMKSKLVSIPRNNLLYLPVTKLNEGGGTGDTARHSTRLSFLVAVDADSQTNLSTIDGVISGENPSSGTPYVRLDQGLDTGEISPARTLDPLLVETQYQIEIDNRLGTIVSIDGTRASISFVDDDNIATYYLSLGTDTDFVEENTDTTTDATQAIAGPRGTLLKFKIQSSLELNTSNFYFNTIGTTGDIVDKDGTTTSYKIIDSTVRVIGVNTGYRVDVPVEFVKKV